MFYNICTAKCNVPVGKMTGVHGVVDRYGCGQVVYCLHFIGRALRRNRASSETVEDLTLIEKPNASFRTKTISRATSINKVEKAIK